MSKLTRREFERVLKNNNYVLCKHQGRGSHKIYSNGVHRISVPGGRSELRYAVIDKLIKYYKLEIIL